jgi:hypothetical protein
MLDSLIDALPDSWHDVAEMASLPIAWIPKLQHTLVTFFIESASPWSAAAKCVFLLFPVLLALAGIWCTQLSIYTLPFRASRTRFGSLLLLAWWDAGRVVWMYWVGIVRLTGVAVGWALAMGYLGVRLLAGFLRETITVPFTMTRSVTQRYFRPGVPWVAFMTLIFWCLLEAGVLAYAARPTMTGVIASVLGPEDVGRFAAPILYGFLFVLVAGSFACLQSFVNAVRRREVKFLIQMIVIQLFVMFFEAMFFYREVVRAMAPWLMEQHGITLSLTMTLVLSAFGWIGVRAATWFLFAQYGTPPLLAFIAREPVAAPEYGTPDRKGLLTRWRPVLDDFRRDIDWLHDKSEQVLELIALPVLQILAAGLNFAMILIAGHAAFGIPFKSLHAVTEARDLEATVQAPARKHAAV